MILQVENLTATQGGIDVLQIPAMEVANNTILAVLGPNASGKTTLLLCLAGLMQPRGGKIFFKGREVSQSNQRAKLRRLVSMVFQDALLFNSSVMTNIEYGLQLRNVSKSERHQRVKETAELFGISHLLGRSAHKLSGGESQRVSLARAFAIKPELLLLDEPFSALDSPSRLSLLNDLGQILKKTNTSAVFSTHDLSEAICLATHVAVLNDGRLVQTGCLEEVIQHPKDPLVANLVDSAKATASRVLGIYSSSMKH